MCIGIAKEARQLPQEMRRGSRVRANSQEFSTKAHKSDKMRNLNKWMTIECDNVIIEQFNKVFLSRVLAIVNQKIMR